MSNNTPSSEDGIPWAVIFTAMTYALISAWMVFMYEWDIWEAMFIVSLVAFVIISLVIGVIRLLAKPEDRVEIWHRFKYTIHDDHDRILKYFRIRRRK